MKLLVFILSMSFCITANCQFTENFFCCPTEMLCGNSEGNPYVDDLLINFNNGSYLVPTSINVVVPEHNINTTVQIPSGNVFITSNAGNVSQIVIADVISADCAGDPLSGSVTIWFEIDGELYENTCSYDGNVLTESPCEQPCPESLSCSANSKVTANFAEEPNLAILDAADIYFSILGPNGNYQSLQTSDKTKVDYSIPGLNCAEDMSYVTLTYRYDNQCVYEDGVLCEDCQPFPDIQNDDICLNFIESCSDYLIDLVNDNTANNGCDQWNTNCDLDQLISRNGPIAIGTDNVPNGYGMAVAGGGLGCVLTEQFKVSPCSDWCDYVFNDNYNLMPINEVEEFINQNNHLPNVPSAKVFNSASGLEVGEITKKQQEKIEELFLYVLDLNENLDKILND